MLAWPAAQSRTALPRPSSAVDRLCLDVTAETGSSRRYGDQARRTRSCIQEGEDSRLVHQLLSGPYSAIADPDGPDDVRNITNRSRKLKRLAEGHGKTVFATPRLVAAGVRRVSKGSSSASAEAILNPT